MVPINLYTVLNPSLFKAGTKGYNENAGCISLNEHKIVLADKRFWQAKMIWVKQLH